MRAQLGVCVFLLVAAAVRAIDEVQCAADTQTLFNNESFVLMTANQWFATLTLVNDSSKIRHDDDDLLQERQDGDDPEGLYFWLSTTDLSKISLLEYQRACRAASGGWCRQVNVSADWQGQDERIFLQGGFGMCFPFSCCDSSGCNMKLGLAAVAATGIESVVSRWCGRNGSESLCPSAAGGGSGGMQIHVSNVCLVTTFDMLMWVALGTAVVLCACGALVLAQRVWWYRQRMEALDGAALGADYDRYDEREEEAARARRERRKRVITAAAFAFGSQPLKPTASEKDGKEESPGSPGVGTALLTGSDAATLDPASGKDAVEDVALVVDEPTDPISLDPILEGQKVVQFPGCGHLFKVESLLVWLENNDTCPVCRLRFLQPADEGEADGRAGVV